MTTPTDMFHLLVVDDDDRLRSLLSRYLKTEGFLVSTVDSVAQAYEALSFCEFDLIILDVMMPQMSGLSLLKNPPFTPLPPILMLTAQGGLEERLEGLSLGADDYLAKPFDPRELSLRLNAILRRTHPKSTLVSFGPLCFDLKQEVLSQDNTPISLTPSEKKLLSFLLAQQGKTLSREDIATVLGESVNLRTVDVHINRLRQKIEPFPSQPRYLQSVRGQGYVLRADP